MAGKLTDAVEATLKEWENWHHSEGTPFNKQMERLNEVFQRRQWLIEAKKHLHEAKVLACDKANWSIRGLTDAIDSVDNILEKDMS